MQATQLRYAIKFVADMDKAVKFYRDVLGLKAKPPSRCTRLVTRVQEEKSNWVSQSPMSRLFTGT